MPTIKLTVPAGAWDTEEKAAIIERLTDGLNSVAEESGKGDIKAFIGCQIEETAVGGYAVGGQILG